MIPVSEPLQCTLELTKRCNLRCKHCYRCSNDPGADELTTEEVLEFFDYLESVGVLEILIEGGEPFARSDWERLLESAVPRFAVSINTNGTLIDAAIARRLRALRVSAIYVNLYDVTPASHDAHTNVEGSFDATVSAIKQLVAAGVRTVMVNIPMRFNLATLPSYIRLCEELGVRNVSLLGLYKLGRARENWDELAASVDELKQNIEKLHSTDKVRIDHRYYPHIHNCCSQACTVDAGGNVIGCSYLREVTNYGNIRQSALLDMWKSDRWRAIRYQEIGGKCTTCSMYKGDCGGGCRAAALTVTGKWNEPDPYCWK